MRLWQRVALVVGVVSVTSLLFSGIIAAVVAERSAIQTADLAQERDVIAVAGSVDRWLKSQADFLTGWALAFDLPNLDPTRQTGLTRAILAAMPSTEIVVLLDGDGQPVTEAVALPGDVEPTLLEGFVDALPVTEAMARPEGFAYGRPTGDLTVPIVVVASSDPPLLVGAALRLEVAAELEARTSDVHAVILVDEEGSPVVGAGHPLLDLPLLEPVLGNVAHSIAYDAPSGPVRGAGAPVGSTGWTVILLESEQLALEGATRIRRLLPAIVGVAIVLALLMGLFLARSVTDPIARLRDSALTLAEGRFGTTTEIDRSDEVGELARAFDHLSRNLAANQQEILRQREEIEAFNQQLQDRVAEATEDLRAAQTQLVRAGQLAAVAQLGAGLAHELNNPLTAVLGLTQMLRRTTSDPGRQEDLQMLEREALRCRGVVDAMVRMADVEEQGPAALRTVFADARGAIGASVGQRGVVLTWGEIPEVEVGAGPGRALRALVQLVSALVAGLPTGAELGIEAEAMQDFVMVRFVPSVPIGVERDDWMASGLDLWLARQALDQLGAELIEPIDPGDPWQVRWALASSRPASW